MVDQSLAGLPILHVGGPRDGAESAVLWPGYTDVRQGNVLVAWRTNLLTFRRAENKKRLAWWLEHQERCFLHCKECATRRRSPVAPKGV